ncbi:MAG TPA: preprotein translocase subunit SecE [Micromonosporaceae bacterium]|nr:preprotein translocase subunit SecE [Micromonosporaceae bacterium]
MAERNRRGEDAADDRRDDEAVDDAVDGDEPISRGGTATRSRKKSDSSDSRSKAKKDVDRVGIFGRIGRFVREVVAELRKVIWPTRKELLTYTAVVVVFVAVIMAIVVGLDFAFAKGVLWVFGNPS